MYINMLFLYYQVHVDSVSLEYSFICYVYQLSLIAPVRLKMTNPVRCFSRHLVWECFVSVNWFSGRVMLCLCVLTESLVLLMELHGSEDKNSYLLTRSNPNLTFDEFWATVSRYLRLDYKFEQ
jgi:hypothetical protein